MGRKQVWPPKILIHKTSGRARVRWQGRDYWLGVPGSPEARTKYLRVLADIERFGQAAPNAAGLTVAGLCDWWEGYAKRSYRPGSHEPVQFGHALRPLKELFGEDLAANFGAKKLKAVQAAMCARVCRNVVNRRITRIKTIFKRACEEELVPGTVYASLQSVRAVPPGTPGVRETAPVEAASDDDLAKVIAHCPPVIAAMLTVARLTGMRPGEVRLMKSAQVEIRVDGSGVYRRRPEDGHKSAWLGRTRVIVLGPKAMAVLSPWLAKAAEHGGYVFRPTDVPGGIVEMFTACTLPQAVRKAAEAAGVTLTPYQLRHAFKVAALAAGGVAGAMQAMGQTSSRAFDQYGRGATAAAEDLARKIG